MSNSKNTNALPPIAIIGMAGRFPGAQNLDEFWRILSEGVETISTFTDSELEFTDADPALLHNPLYVNRKAILDGVDLFDAAFFGYSPREAELSDPQQRFFLQCAYEALETAGYDPDRFPGLIGVFGGSGFSHYLFANLLSNRELLDSVGFFETSIRNCADHLATTVAYKLNLKGPAVTVQTACSTSLVAVHFACQSLINFECDMALAGGVSIALPQKSGYLHQEGGILSPDGHCRAFDAEAQGTVTGNGAAVIVLKRLEDALQDRDNIEAVILGSAIGNDGSLKAGYAAPGIEGQAQVIAEAQSVAGVHPETITYIEAHGTGTKLGDPIEIDALNQVFQETTNRKNFCAIGSLKTNIGHLDTASGVAGLIKVVLSLRHKMLPPSLHFERPNPEINFSDSPFFVNAQLRPWNVQGPRRAGVSSFGIGGTNAHAILEEPPAVASGKETRACQLLVFSAKTAAALDSAANNVAAFLERHRLEVDLADVAYTLQTGRREYKYRRAIVCRNHDDALAALKTRDSSRTVNGSYEAKDRSIVFMFPGQGAQYINMGQGLYESEPVFRRELERCAMLAQAHLGFNLLDVLYSKHPEEASSRLTQTQVAQPALFAIEYSLARLWMQWGIQPAAMIGHSVGEYVAACLAGVLSLEDALRLVIIRGRLMQSLPAGTMLAVQQPEEELSRRLVRRLDLAAINGPDSCVVSGPVELVEQFESQLSAAGIACRRLATSHAFHSAMMEPILSLFRDECKQATFHTPQLPFISNLSGTWITTDKATSPDYWTRHLRESVRFGDGLRELLQDPESILLEVGPGRALAALARKNSHRAARHLVLSSLRHAEDPTQDDASLLNALGKLWVAGVQVDWSGFYQHEQRKRVPLPVYPFEPKRYWIEPKKQTEPRPEPLEKKGIAEWFYTPSWKSIPLAQKSFSLPQRPWLVFADPYGCGFKLVEELQRLGAQVFTVEQGREYLWRDQTFTVRPEVGQDYEVMLKSLHEKGQFPAKIVHFWSLAQPTLNHFSSRPDIDLSFWSPVLLARAIGTLDSPPPTELLLISNSLYNVIGDKTFLPERATLLGPCRVIPQEYANISCRHIDLDILPGEETQPVIWSNLVAEFVSATQEKVVAYRKGHRWVQAFEPLPLVPPPSKLPIVRDKGTYLITGGLGGIGLTLADELARSAKARLILIGRSSFPPRESWMSWLDSHDEEDPTGIKIRKLMSWEKIGAEVLVMTADVSSQVELCAAISIARQRFGEIHGILHCAGIPGGGVIQLKAREAAHAVLAPKVQGTMLLAAALQSTPLDFFIACSSQASILGGFAQVDYCAASAFLDVFAHHCRSNHSVPMMSVNWDAWQDVGMLARKAGEWGVGTEEATTRETPLPLRGQREVESSQRETFSSTFRSNSKNVLGNGHQHWEDYPSVVEGVVASVYAASLQRGITPTEGQDAFRHILSAAELPQLIVSTTSLQASIAEARSSASLKRMVENTSDTLLPHTLHPRPAIQTPYVGPRDESERRIVESWQRVLGVAEIGIHDNYFDLGGDSVHAIQIVAQMNRKGFHLTPQQLFQHQTVAELAKVAAGSQPLPSNFSEVALETNSSEFPLAGLNEEELKELEKFLEETDEKQLG